MLYDFQRDPLSLKVKPHFSGSHFRLEIKLEFFANRDLGWTLSPWTVNEAGYPQPMFNEFRLFYWFPM